MKNPVQKDRPFLAGGTASFRQKDAILQRRVGVSRNIGIELYYVRSVENIRV